MTLGGYEHQSYPFDRLVEELDLSRNTGRSALFDVMVDLHNEGDLVKADNEDGLSGMEVHPFKGAAHVQSKFDLTFGFTESADGLYAGIEYSTELFNASTIERLGRHLGQLLEAALENPDAPISKLVYYSGDDYKEEWSRGKERAEEADVISQFELCVKSHGKSTAIESDGLELSYEELNKKANQLGHYLLSLYPAAPTQVVGILLDRGTDLVEALLGVLKSGRAYLALDPEYPAERLSYMLSQSGASIVISSIDHLDKLPGYEGLIYAMDVQQEHKKESEENPEVSIQSTDLAYVLYTSGSTGRPKGVRISHGNLSNYITWAKDAYGLGEEKTSSMSLFSSVSFDLTVTSIFTPLCSGGQVYIYPQWWEISKDPFP